MVHMWKISPQANTFIFSPNSPDPFMKPCWPPEFLGCSVKRILECLLLFLGLDVVCQDLEKGTEVKAESLIEWIHYRWHSYSLGTTRNQNQEGSLTKPLHAAAPGLVPWKKSICQGALSPSPSFILNLLAGRRWDCLEVLLTDEQNQGGRVTQDSSGPWYWSEPHEITILMSPERPTVVNFMWVSLIFMETDHCVCLSECRVRSVAGGSPEAPDLEKAGTVPGSWELKPHGIREGKKDPQKHGLRVWILDSSLDCNPGSSRISWENSFFHSVFSFVKHGK